MVDETPEKPAFVILAAQDPAQNPRLAAIVNDLNLEVAIFIAETDIAQILGDPAKSKAEQLSDLPNAFTAKINLRQMSLPEKSVAATTTNQLQDAKTVQQNGSRSD